VFYQPPVFYWLPKVVADRQVEFQAEITEKMEAAWVEVRHCYETLGLALPPFDPKGVFFSFNRDRSVKEQRKIGSVQWSDDGWNQVVDIHRSAFELITRNHNRSGSSLCEVVGKIELLGANASLAKLASF
jgi:hypothetical protein